jgi:hypothetical protein
VPSEEEIKAAAQVVDRFLSRGTFTVTDAERNAAEEILEAAEKVRAEKSKLVLKLPPQGYVGRLEVRFEVGMLRYRFLDGIELKGKPDTDLLLTREMWRLFALEGEHQWRKAALDMDDPTGKPEPASVMNAREDAYAQCRLWHRAAEGEPWRLVNA